MNNRFVKINEKDMVATALVNLKKDENADIFSSENEYLESIKANEKIPYGNKIALMDINKSEKIIKYGEVIGECVENIKKGDLVHVHNVKSLVVDIPSEFKKEIIRQMKINSKGDN